jgi:hypothetical protein
MMGCVHVRASHWPCAFDHHQSVGADARKPVMAAVGPHSLQDAQQDVILQLPLLVARAHSQMRELLKQDADAFKVMSVGDQS